MSLHTCRFRSSIDRRDFVALLGAGLLATLAGCHSSPVKGGAAPGPGSMPPQVDGSTSTTATLPPFAPIPPPRPGPAQVVSHAPKATTQVALTIDDGYCVECVAGYVDFADR